MSNYISNIPNALTIIRVALIPVFILSMELGSSEIRFFAFILFVFGAITDYVDGYIARKYAVVSDFGKLLDPVADKILVMAALVALVGEINLVSGKSLIPAWLVVFVLARETWVNGLRLVAASEGIVVAADTLGKYKTAVQMFGIILCLLAVNLDFILSLQNFVSSSTTSVISLAAILADIGFVFLIVSLVLSYISGYQYTSRILGAKTGAL